MLYEIFKFEILFRIKRLDTYIYFIFLFLFSIVGVDFIYGGIDLGEIKRNSPLIISKTMGALSGISMMITSLIMGVPILRDFEYEIESLIFVNPIKKRDYLIGRFLGSFVILILIFTALIFGNALGEMMPWRNQELLLPFSILTYIQPYFTIVLPILFFGATLFFITGALSKKLIVVYTQGLFTFVLFLLTRSIENRFIGAILDPFSLTTLTELTKDWTTAEINSQLIPFTNELMYSKLFWIVIGFLILAFGYKKFRFQVVSNSSKKKIITKTELNLNSAHNLPIFTTKTGLKSQCIQLIQNAWFYFISILKEVSFWAIVISAMVIILINSISLGTVYNVNSYPATHFIIEELVEMSGYFFIIVMVFYSGELIWKERSAKLHLIYDALPSNNGITLMGKFIGLAFIYMVIMIALIIAGIVFQISHGYYKFEIDVYFISFFCDLLPFLLMYTFISFFIHVLVNKKFVAYILVLTLFIITIALDQLGYNHDLYSFGGHNLGTYSQMNGYGHLLIPFLWIKVYWFVFCAFIIMISNLFLVRGTETNYKIRLKQAKQRITLSVIKIGLVIIVIFIGIGSFIFYNSNILNKRWSTSEAIKFRVGYEKTLKKFEYISQPKLVDVNINVELYPNQRNYTAEGRYILVNQSKKPIYELHIQKLIDDQVSLEYIKLNKETTLSNKYLTYDYYLYTFKEVLQPGDSLTMKFKQVFTTNGFEIGDTNTKIVHNGTFFDNKDFPTLGYDKKYELSDENKRASYNLPVRSNKANRDDSKEVVNALSGGDSDGILFEMIIGTAINQTAIAPGNLLKKWTANNRNYFHYKLDFKMINFYSIVSAEYEVKKDVWYSEKSEFKEKFVDLEIYYHKEHDYNLDRMMKAMKASFNYFTTNFSPYQYKQIRILEFPRYAEFAQSFPGTVPFSEAIGFVLDIDDEKDVDMAFYVTAHELAHQWFGMQVEAAYVKGRLMILETLSQYAAIMVLKQHYSEEKVRQFLEIQKERYLKKRRKGGKEEPSLALVENQDHVYYAKGAINMYKFQNQIGEEKVNLALKKFIKDWNTANGKLKISTGRYPTTKDLLRYFRAVTPNSLQHVVTDLFENVSPLNLK